MISANIRHHQTKEHGPRRTRRICHGHTLGGSTDAQSLENARRDVPG